MHTEQLIDDATIKIQINQSAIRNVLCQVWNANFNKSHKRIPKQHLTVCYQRHLIVY